MERFSSVIRCQLKFICANNFGSIALKTHCDNGYLEFVLNFCSELFCVTSQNVDILERNTDTKTRLFMNIKTFTS